MRSTIGAVVVPVTVLVTLALAVDPPAVAAQYSGGAWVAGGDFGDVVVGSGPGAGRVRIFASDGFPLGDGFEPYPGWSMAPCDIGLQAQCSVIVNEGTTTVTVTFP